jgi:hypothetical protein
MGTEVLRSSAFWDVVVRLAQPARMVGGQGTAGAAGSGGPLRRPATESAAALEIQQIGEVLLLLLTRLLCLLLATSVIELGVHLPHPCFGRSGGDSASAGQHLPFVEGQDASAR